MWKSPQRVSNPALFNQQDMKDNRSSEQREFDSCTFQPSINDSYVSHPRSAYVPRKGVTISESVLHHENNSTYENQNYQHKEDEKEIAQKDEGTLPENGVCSLENEEENQIVMTETDTVVRALYLYYQEILHLDNKMTEAERLRVNEKQNCASSSSKVKVSAFEIVEDDAGQSENIVGGSIIQKKVRAVPANYEKSLIHLKRGKDKREADLLLKKSKELRNYEVVGDISDRIRDYSLDARRNKQKIRSNDTRIRNNPDTHNLVLTETFHDNQTCHRHLISITKEMPATSSSDIPTTKLTVKYDGRHIEIDEHNPDTSDMGDFGDSNNDKIDDNSDKSDSNNIVDIIPENAIPGDVISDIWLFDQSLKLKEVIQTITPVTYQNEENSLKIKHCNKTMLSDAVTPLNSKPYTDNISPTSCLEIESPLNSSIDDSRLINHNIITQTFDIDESHWFRNSILDEDKLNIIDAMVEPESFNMYTTPSYSTSSSVSMASRKKNLCTKEFGTKLTFTRIKNVNDSIDINKDRKRCTSKKFVRNNTSSVSERHKKMIEKYQTSLGTDVKTIEQYLDPIKFHLLHHATLNK
jgi:hypothetical protein